MALHKTLPDHELHEVKGAVSASDGLFLIANGDGTATFQASSEGQTSVNEFTGSVVLVAGDNITINSGSNEIAISGTSGNDEKVKVTSNDTTADYLYNKLIAGPDITLTEANDGGDEKLVISGTFTESDDVDSLNEFIGSVTISAGTNITVNSGSNDIKISASFTESDDVDSLNGFIGSVNIVAGDDITINSGSNEIVISGTAGGGTFGSEHYEAESTSESSTTSSTWQTKVTFTTSALPSGKYRIGFSSEFSNSKDELTEVRVIVGGTPYATPTGYPYSTDEWMCASGFFYIDPLSGGQTVSLQYRAGDQTAYIRNARIDLWRID